METFLSVVSVCLPVVGVVSSAAVSFLISRNQAKSEIKKALVKFEREDKVSERQAFADLLSSTQEYCVLTSPINRKRASESVAAYLSLSPQETELLKQIDVALENKDVKQISLLRSELLNKQLAEIQHTNHDS